MAKKDNLRKIIRGKGMEAFRPSVEDLSTEKKGVEKEDLINHTRLSVITTQDEAIQYPQAERIVEKLIQEKRLSQNCVISEIEVSQEQQEIIERILGENSHQIVIWDAYISQAGKRGIAFKMNKPLSFNICCAASGLLEQLKPELGFHWITYDLQHMQLQTNYRFYEKTKPIWPNFQICYNIQPALPGIFKFHVIVDIEATDLFWFKDGFEFKIS